MSKPPRWFAVGQVMQPVVFVLVAIVAVSKGSFGGLGWVGYLAMALGVSSFLTSWMVLRLSWDLEERPSRPTRVQWAWAGVGWGLSLGMLLIVVV